MRHSVLVRTKNEAILIPLATPHYKQSLVTYKNTDKEAREIGREFAVVESKEPQYRERWAAPDFKKVWAFWDSFSRKFKDYAPKTMAEPTASYNGLIWWTVKNQYIIPTFVDLHDPGKIYYRKDKIVSVQRGLKMHNCHGEHRFITAESENGWLLIDLATSTVTKVRTVEYLELDGDGGKKGEIVAGFVNGSFVASVNEEEEKGTEETTVTATA